MKRKVNYRLGDVPDAQLSLLKNKLGLSETAVIELAIGKLAQLEGLDQALFQQEVVQRYYAQYAKEHIIH